MAAAIGLATGLDATAECPKSTGFRLQVDDSQAVTVLDVIRSHQVSDARIKSLSESVATQAAIEHTVLFDPRATAASWRAGLEAAALGETLKDDPFRFGALSEAQSDVSQTIALIDANRTQLQGGIESALGPYVPEGMTISAEMRLIAGARATGWADPHTDAFYFNVRRGAGDLAGVRTLATHELYHVVLAHLLPKPKLPISTSLGRVERVILNGIDEGMASHVARFDPRQSGLFRRAELTRTRKIRRVDARTGSYSRAL